MKRILLLFAMLCFALCSCSGFYYMEHGSAVEKHTEPTEQIVPVPTVQNPVVTTSAVSVTATDLFEEEATPVPTIEVIAEQSSSNSAAPEGAFEIPLHENDLPIG